VLSVLIATSRDDISNAVGVGLKSLEATAKAARSGRNITEERSGVTAILMLNHQAEKQRKRGQSNKDCECVCDGATKGFLLL